MNLNLSGRHLDITPAIRSYVLEKLGRVTRHFDHVIDLNVILSVDKLDRQILKHKEKLTIRRHEEEPMKRQIGA